MTSTRNTSVDIGHHIVSLIEAKPRTASELVRLAEVDRVTVWRHLRSLEMHQLITRDRAPTRRGAIYSWHRQS